MGCVEGWAGQWGTGSKLEWQFTYPVQSVGCLQTISAEALHFLPSCLERALIITLVIDTDTCACVFEHL